MKDPALVILAAGLGSRYGGNKQIDGVGPNGEILMEYGIHDAICAGFRKIVLLIKPDMLEFMKKLCGDRLEHKTAPDGRPIELCYAFQDYSSIPSFYKIPEERIKPFGTSHALLCTRSLIDEPFVVINADDYYGPEAFRAAYAALQTLRETGEALMVDYTLENTLSLRGAVTRGICTIEDGYLKSVVETFRIERCGDGVVRDMISETEGVELDPRASVSMNFWGFMPSIFDELESGMNDFLRSLAPDEIKKEYLLPSFVDDQIRAGRLSVRALHTGARWFGITYQADKAYARERLRALHEQGLYPDRL